MKDLKFSRYAIPVKCDNGDVFLLNGLTGAIDIVDAVTYTKIGSNDLTKVSDDYLCALERRSHLTALFSCPYCFEHTTAVRKSQGKTMDRRMVDLCFNAITRLAEKEPHHSKTIILYGGEPLLSENACFTCNDFTCTGKSYVV